MKIGEAIELLEGMIYEQNTIISYSSELPEIYIKEKVALEEAVKVLKQYNRLVQVKVRPVKQHIKIQYEGEELTIRELIERLEDVQAWRKHWKELAMRQDKQIDELRRQLADVQSVRHGRWITVVGADGKEYSKCSGCQTELDGLEDAYSFCPHCGAKMDGGEDDGQAD